MTIPNFTTAIRLINFLFGQRHFRVAAEIVTIHQLEKYLVDSYDFRRYSESALTKVKMYLFNLYLKSSDLCHTVTALRL